MSESLYTKQAFTHFPFYVLTELLMQFLIVPLYFQMQMFWNVGGNLNIE